MTHNKIYSTERIPLFPEGLTQTKIDFDYSKIDYSLVLSSEIEKLMTGEFLGEMYLINDISTIPPEFFSTTSKI